jgi:hypothetical protein
MEFLNLQTMIEIVKTEWPDALLTLGLVLFL